MSIEIIPAAKSDAHIIAHLWPLYQYDLSEYGGTPINADGLFEEPSMREHDYRTDLEMWWRNAGRLNPFLIRIDGRAAGLVVIGVAPAFAPADSDYFVHEFFILRGFRRQGIAQAIATEIFTQFCGRWELHVLPPNQPAIAFWRKVLQTVAGDSYTEQLTYVEADHGDMVIFRFDNGQVETISND